ncbi:MAG TPA: kinase [Alphaproteobacteria bacterium]|nr:kinase [Alphaproteobacteria bacterium]
MALTKALVVWWDQTQVGVLDMDVHGDTEFVYAKRWLEAETSRPLSASLPLRAEPFKRREWRPFFAGLLPEQDQRKGAARALGISEDNDYALLDALGGDVAGALTLLPPGQSPSNLQPSSEHKLLTEAETYDLLQEMAKRPLLAGTEGLRLSLAGAQSKLPVCIVSGKIALPRTGEPSTHILKPPILDFPATTENEAFCLSLAKACDLSVATARPAAAQGLTFLLVKRYDRSVNMTHLGTAGRNGEAYRVSCTRIHQEDFCQGLGVSPEKKYSADGGPGFKQCFELVGRMTAVPAKEAQKLLDAALFNLIIGNCDAHGKNFSLLYTEQGAVLAPLYDLLSTVVYPGLSHRLAMKIGGDAVLEEMTERTWERFAKDIGMTAPFVRRRAGEMAALASDQAQPAADALKLPFLDAAALDRHAELVRTRAAKVMRIAVRPTPNAPR